MSNGKIKIQINSLDALNRLIGDDLELEYEVKRSVIEAFANSYIKTIAHSKEIAKEVNSLRDEVHKQAREFIKDELGIDQLYGRLNGTVQSEIKSLVLHQIRDIVDETVKRELRAIEEKVQTHIDVQLDASVRKHIGKIQHDKIVEAVERVLRDNL